MKRLSFLAICVALGFVVAMAQPRQTLIKVVVTPDHADWVYKCGEKPRFDVEVLTCSNAAVENAEIRYEISEDFLEPLEKSSRVLPKGKVTLSGHTMKQPGFLRCRVWAKVNGKSYEECATAAFEPERIVPKTVMPDDFDQFWKAALDANQKVDMMPQLTLVPERCTPRVKVYSARFQTHKSGSYIYGTMCVPANLKEGERVPAILIVPGAGCRSRKGYFREAERGFVTLEVGIHGIPTVLKDESIYENLKQASLLDYPSARVDDKDKYFYKRVFVGCARAIDFLAGLDFVDAERIGVMGGSQGGALSITTAALNPRVKCAAVFYPAMCDLTGYLYNQGNSWPYLFKNKALATKERLETVKYYDVVNFARRLQVPIFFTYGYNDLVVCPTSMQGCYNIVTAPKEALIVPQSRHYTYPEQSEARSNWVMNQLKK